ncbi:acyl-CoA dehydrogenase family protein [Streptomyces sp. NPDC002623]
MQAPASDELRQFADVVREFATEQVAPHVLALDRTPFNDHDAGADPWQGIYQLGMLGVMLPEACGGLGQGLRALCTVVSTLAEVDASSASFVLVNELSQRLLLAAGEERRLSAMVETATSAREHALAFPAFNDPSDTEILPMATVTDGQWRLNGELESLALGSWANQALIPARILDEDDYSLFLVDLDMEAVTRAQVLTHGLHSLQVSDIQLAGANAVLVGTPGAGAAYFRSAVAPLEIASAAIAGGLTKACLDTALAYASDRHQGGRPIIDWSEVRSLLAGMLTRSATIELSIGLACELFDSGNDVSPQAKAAALFAHELACEVVNDGVQVLGGYGYMKDYGQEKRFRDARQLQTLFGTPSLRKLDLIESLTAIPTRTRSN